MNLTDNITGKNWNVYDCFNKIIFFGNGPFCIFIVDFFTGMYISICFLKVFLKNENLPSVLEGTLRTKKIILLLANACILPFILRYGKNLNIKSQQTPVQTQMSSHTICLIYNCLKMFFTYVDGVQQNRMHWMSLGFKLGFISDQSAHLHCMLFSE